MALGKRPGGLTALAVLNFVFGGIGALASLLAFGGLSLVKEAIHQAEQNGMKYEGQSLSMAYVSVAVTGVCALLLIISGVGYIKQSRVAGRTVGNLYGLASIGGTVLSAATGGGIGAFSILFLVYPLLTLILINSAFKANLTN